MNGTWVSIKSHDGLEFGAYLSTPPTGRGPGLVLVQEIWGVNEHIRALADSYALDGYVVLAPDVFWRQAPRVDLAYDEPGSKRAYELMGHLDGEAAIHDMVSTLKALKLRSDVTGKVGIMGFCLGGRLAYQGAAHGPADAAVCYYGGRIQNHLDLAAKIKVPILFHYAENDAHISKEAVDSVRHAFSGHEHARVEVYPGVDHGFNCWGRPMYDQKAAALAHGRTLEWLSSALA